MTTEENKRPLPEQITRRRVAAVFVLIAFVAVGFAAQSAPGGFVGARGLRLSGASGHELRAMRRALRVRLSGAVRRHDRAINRVLSYTPYVSKGGRRHKEVALTFDDGPGPDTWRVVRQLRRLRVRATFFQVGQQMAAFPGAARLVPRWFPVGDHTLTHPPLASLGRTSQRGEVLAQAARMRGYGERFPRLFRPPYASFDAATLAVLRRWRMLMVLWSVDSED